MENILNIKNKKQIIDDELVVAEKFINFLNKEQSKNFALPHHPKDGSFDAESYDKSDPQKKIKMEIVKSDFKAREAHGKTGKYARYRTIEEKIQDLIIEPINHKSKKLNIRPILKRTIYCLLMVGGLYIKTKWIFLKIIQTVTFF